MAKGDMGCRGSGLSTHGAPLRHGGDGSDSGERKGSQRPRIAVMLHSRTVLLGDLGVRLETGWPALLTACVLHADVTSNSVAARLLHSYRYKRAARALWGLSVMRYHSAARRPTQHAINRGVGEIAHLVGEIPHLFRPLAPFRRSNHEQS